MVRRDSLRRHIGDSVFRIGRPVHPRAHAARGARPQIRGLPALYGLPRTARQSRHRRGQRRHHVGPAYRADLGGAGRGQARVSGKADGPYGGRLPADLRRRRQGQGPSHGRPHLPLQPALRHGQAGNRRRQYRQGPEHEFAAQYSGRLDAGDSQQDRTDRRRRHPRHRPDAVVHRGAGDQRLCPDGRSARPEISGRRADHVPLRQRRHGDPGDGLVHAGKDPLRYRRTHERHRVRRLRPYPGHVPQYRHLHQGRLSQSRHDLLADAERRHHRRLARPTQLFRHLLPRCNPPTIITPEEAMAALEAALAAEESAATGQVVHL